MHRKARVDQRHRPVAKLGRAQCFRMQPAGLLQLQRGFLRNSQPQPAPDYIQVASRRERRNRSLPIQFPGALERRGRLRQRIQQLFILRPKRHEMNDRRQGRDVRLRGRHTLLASRTQRDGVVGCFAPGARIRR